MYASMFPTEKPSKNVGDKISGKVINEICGEHIIVNTNGSYLRCTVCQLRKGGRDKSQRTRGYCITCDRAVCFTKGGRGCVELHCLASASCHRKEKNKAQQIIKEALNIQDQNDE